MGREIGMGGRDGVGGIGETDREGEGEGQSNE